MLSAWIGRGMDDPTKSYVRIYSFYDNGIPDPHSVVTIMAKDFGLNNLDISDITVDAVTNIYVIDRRGIMVQFSYDG